MSQLDVCITFSHFFGMVVCYYFFFHYMIVVLINFWYNQKLRYIESIQFEQEIKELKVSKKLNKILNL